METEDDEGEQTPTRVRKHPHCKVCHLEFEQFRIPKTHKCSPCMDFNVCQYLPGHKEVLKQKKLVKRWAKLRQQDAKNKSKTEQKEMARKRAKIKKDILKVPSIASDDDWLVQEKLRLQAQMKNKEKYCAMTTNEFDLEVSYMCARVCLYIYIYIY